MASQKQIPTLQKQVANIPFSKGVQTKKTDVTLETGELEVLENAIFDKHGQIEKRKGYTETEFEYPAGAGTHFFEGAFQYKGAYYGLESSGYVWRVNPSSPDKKYQNQSRWSPISTEVFSLTPHDFTDDDQYNFVYTQSPEIAISTDDSLICIAAAVKVEAGAGVDASWGYSISLVDASNMSILKTTLGAAGSNGFATGRYEYRIKPVAISATKFAVYYEFDVDDDGIPDALHRTIVSVDDMGVIGVSGDSKVALISSEYREDYLQQSFDVIESFTADSAQVAYYRYDVSETQHFVYVALDKEITDNVGSPDLDDVKTLTYGLGSGGDVPPSTGEVGLKFTHIALGKSSVVADKIYLAYMTKDTSESDYHTRIYSFSEGDTPALTGGLVLENTDAEASFRLLCFVDNKEDPEVLPQKYSGGNTIDLVYNSGATTFHGVATYRIAMQPSTLSYAAGGALTEINKGQATGGAFQFAFGKNDYKTTIFPNLGNYKEFREFQPFGTLDYFTQDGNLVGSSLTSRVPSEFNAQPGRAIKSSDGTAAYVAISTLGVPQTVPSILPGFENGGYTSIPTIVKYTFDAVTTYGVRRAEIGKNIYWTAGNALFRDSFDVYQDIAGKPKPHIVSLTAGGAVAGADLDESAVYQYKVVWEQEDSQGNLYQSEPSDPMSVTSGTGTSSGGISRQAVTIVISSATQKIKGGNHRAVIYRTEGGGNLFHLAGYITGQHSAYTQSFVDKISDDSVLSARSLYTDSGEVPNTRCPACFYVTAHRNRLFIISEDNRIFFSKEYKEAYGVGFNDTFYVPLDGILDDKPTALGSSGETLYIFRENSIWALDGDGPSVTADGKYYTPRIVSNSMGALKGSPTLYTDIGLFFQNPRGIHAITKEGIKYIGSPVESILGTSRIMDIIQDQATSTIRFLLNTSVLVYNYVFGQWSHFTFSTLGSDRFVGMGNNDGEITLVTDSNKFWKESGYKLGTSYLVMKMRTGWISLNGIQGFSRAYRFSLLGKSRDKHILTIKIYYDYDDSVAVDTYTFSTTVSTTDALLQFRAHLSKQKCEAIKFEIYDADNSSTTGDGFVIENIALEIGSKRGIFRMTQQNTIGSV